MFSYLAFLHGKTAALSDQAFTEGQALASQCIRQLEELDDREQFPPRLLILLTPPDFRDQFKARQLLDGIHETFDKAAYKNVPLIGGSVVAVFFDQQVHPKGALLICLASRLLEAEVKVAEKVSATPEQAIDDLLRKLALHTEDGEDVDPFANRMLLSLFPGFQNKTFPAPGLHQLLQDKLKARVPIFGGVTSADDRQRIATGLQYADGEVYQDAVVAAKIDSGTPLSLSLSHGLTATPRILQVSRLGNDSRSIKAFHQGKAPEVVREEEARWKIMLLENLSAGRQSVVEKPIVVDDHSIQMLREVEKDAAFRVWRPDPEEMIRVTTWEVENSLQRIRLENPIACLGFRCAGHYRYHKIIGLNLEREFAEIEKLTGLYLGAFMDGEAGMDGLGRAALSNWSTATMVFGDELRDRTPFHKGFVRLAEFTRQPDQPLKEAFTRLCQLIYDIGYPGAMLSLVLQDQKEKMIVARAARGSRFRKIVKQTRREWDGNDILAIVARNKESKFVFDSSGDDSNCDQEAVNKSGTISQYIIPLITVKGEVIALLQIDLGDARYKKEGKLHPNEKVVLEALGNVVSSELNRVFNREENKIIHSLDSALKECLSQATIKGGLQQYLEEVVKAFGLMRGHIRVFQPESSRMVLTAGVGAYAEIARKFRPEIESNGSSPTAQAFSTDKIIIINHAAVNPDHQKLKEPHAGHPEWEAAIKQVGSYINVPFKSEGGERGTISLVSDEPWFFNLFHERACQSLGERVGFLAEYLQRKEGEAAARKREEQVNRNRRMVRAKVALVAQSSHRFWELLSELKDMPEQIRSAAEDGVREEKIRELSERIDKATVEIKRHISLAENAQDIHIQEIEFHTFISELVEKAPKPKDANVINTVVDVVPQDLKGWIYPDLMREAFFNLINNSITAMSEIEARNHTLTTNVSLDEEGKNVKLIFTDTGKGMSREKVETLKQSIDGRTSIKKRTQAMGWGLPITSVLLEAHGGKIQDITSEENSGTTVTVILPLDQQEEAYET